jgi:hypothetical protein
MMLYDMVRFPKRFVFGGRSVMKIDGRCHCGYITYETEADPANARICHCTDCQTLSGSAFRTGVLTKEGSFKLNSGTPTIYVKTAESGVQRPEAFCPKCGSPIYATTIGEGPKVHAVRLGTVRQRDQFAPKLQLWFRSAQHWVTNVSSIPQIEKQSASSSSRGFSADN